MKMEERDRLIREDGIAQGITQGQTAAIKSFIDVHRKKGSSEADILTMIQEYFQLNAEDASTLLKQV